jgi:hypothetical protein
MHLQGGLLLAVQPHRIRAFLRSCFCSRVGEVLLMG